jgi:hypothetical protein
MALSRKYKLKLVLALLGAAAVIIAAIITVTFSGSSDGSRINQQGNGNTACQNNSQC